MQAGQRGNQSGTNFLDVACEEHGTGCDCEYFGDNDAQLDRINVFYPEGPGGKFVPRAVVFDLEPAVVGSVRASPSSSARVIS
jgi:tubulin beta